MQISYRALLDYTYAPAIGLCYFLALIFGLCTLQKAATVRLKKRCPVALSMLIIVISYVLEALFYIYQWRTDNKRSVPQHSIFRILIIASTWTALTVHLYRTKALLWNPYIGVFVLGFLFESMGTGLLLSTPRY